MSVRTKSIFVDLTIQTKQPVSFSHHGIEGLPMMVRGVDIEGRPLKTVFLPAAQFRGRLRHEAALAVMRKAEEPVKLEEAYMLALGQDLKPEEDSEPEAIRLGDQIKFRNDNPFLDLFGTWKVASRLFVSHLMPEVNVRPDKFHNIRRDLDTNEEIFDALGVGEVDRFYDRQDAQSKASQVGNLIKSADLALRKAKKDKNAALVEELEGKLEEFKTLKKTHKGGDESENTKHLVELEAIPAGIDLIGKINIHTATAFDIKTIVDALDGVSRDPMFGAQRARGCGEISGQASLRNGDGEILGTVVFGDFKPATVEWTEQGRAFLS